MGSCFLLQRNLFPSMAEHLLTRGGTTSRTKRRAKRQEKTAAVMEQAQYSQTELLHPEWYSLQYNWLQTRRLLERLSGRSISAVTQGDGNSMRGAPTSSARATAFVLRTQRLVMKRSRRLTSDYVQQGGNPGSIGARTVNTLHDRAHGNLERLSDGNVPIAISSRI